MARVYEFELPYEIPGWQDSIGVSELQGANLWSEVPLDLQQKMTAGEGLFGPGVSVTKADLDELPDSLWEYVADKFSLQWHEA